MTAAATSTANFGRNEGGSNENQKVKRSHFVHAGSLRSLCPWLLGHQLKNQHQKYGVGTWFVIMLGHVRAGDFRPPFLALPAWFLVRQEAQTFVGKTSKGTEIFSQKISRETFYIALADMVDR